MHETPLNVTKVDYGGGKCRKRIVILDASIRAASAKKTLAKSAFNLEHQRAFSSGMK
jgi:hypothetical protein